MKIPDKPNFYSIKNGFTLIEMSVVMVVLGIVIGAIAPLLVSQIKQDRTREVREVVNVARDEVVGFARVHGRLPTRTEFSSQIGHTIDAWRNELFYLPAQGMTEPDDLCDDIASKVGLSIEAPGREQDILRAAFILGSKGSNHQSNTYFSSDGANTLIQSKTQDSLNDEGVEGKVIIKSYGQDDLAGNKYDDIVEFVTIYYLDSRICP